MILLKIAATALGTTVLFVLTSVACMIYGTLKIAEWDGEDL